MGWLCDYFRLLPSDPRIGTLTSEQVNDLMLQLNHLHPDQFKLAEADPDYEREEQEALASGEGVLYDDLEVVPFTVAQGDAVILSEEAPQGILTDRIPDAWEDIEF